MGKISKRLIIGVLCVALVIGFIPNFNAPINAASETIHLTQADFNKAKDGTPTKGITYNSGVYFLNAGSYILDENIAEVQYLSIYSGSTVIDLNKKSLSARLFVCGSDEGIPNVTIKGDGTITNGVESAEGATVTINGANFGRELNAFNKGIFIINSAVVNAEYFAIYIDKTSKATINGGKFSAGNAGLHICAGSSVSLSGGTFVCKKGFGPLNNVSVQKYTIQSGIVIRGNGDDSDAKKAFESLLANGCEYSNQSQFEYSFFEPDYFYTNQPTITVINNNVTPENKQVTPEENNNNNNNNNNNKKNYKNEWVDHQWYDSNGNATYKYKGYWKCNEKGWWFEDENGWYPQDQWQKIDGKWYFFDAIGYMAQNEYAGSWSSYSEGNWWVGEDGAWDGSEPGVWRLSSNGKWWFKDSTGWFAQSKWYKIRGTWYYFDDEGWWDESKTE